MMGSMELFCAAASNPIFVISTLVAAIAMLRLPAGLYRFLHAVAPPFLLITLHSIFFSGVSYCFSSLLCQTLFGEGESFTNALFGFGTIYTILDVFFLPGLMGWIFGATLGTLGRLFVCRVIQMRSNRSGKI